ncbi:hypothetical protein LSAT2_027440 [Lamellibrachia satsuma]|nr:hypothetical protein LSAT2_027440 [Lamellibrachia satsuma]
MASSSQLEQYERDYCQQDSVAAKKPLLQPQTVKARLWYTRQYKDWTVEQWNNVLWSDESSFQLLCGAKQAFVKRQKGKGLAHSALSPQLSMEGAP